MKSRDHKLKSRSAGASTKRTTSQQGTMSQHSPSSILSIIPDHWVDQFQKVKDTVDFCKLHAQFWGTPVGDFRSKDKSKGKSKDKSMDIDVGGVDEEEGDKEEGDEKEGDEEEEEDLNDFPPIDPGDYTLDVGIQSKQIYVRKEYDLLYNVCSAYLEQDEPTEKILSAVVTGQPGIGECSS